MTLPLESVAPGYELLKAACADFVEKVENNQARSVRSYAKMKTALMVADGKLRAIEAEQKEDEIRRFQC